MPAIREYLLRRLQPECEPARSCGSVRFDSLTHTGGRRLRNRKLNYKTGNDRMIILHTYCTAMFGDNARSDGKTEAGAAILGRKLREEEFVFVFRRNTVTRVFNTDLDRVGFDMPGRRNTDVAFRGVFQRL